MQPAVGLRPLGGTKESQSEESSVAIPAIANQVTTSNQNSLIIKYMNSMSLPEYRNHLERKFLAKVSSRITHFQTNDGWVSREGGTDDPINSTKITTTPRAITQQVADLTAVFQALDYVTRKNVIDAFIVAHAASNTLPTKQQFRRR
jgi:hypothetical protein